MIRSLFVVFLALAARANGKLPPGTSWTSFASNKPVYSRSLGPPGISGLGTITVPYMPKPLLFPKLVDPRIMISKKNELLNNLFGGISPVDYPGYGTAGSALYSMSSGKDEDIPDPKNMNTDENIVTDKNVPYTGSDLYKRGMFGPVGPKFPFSGMSKYEPSSFGSVEDSYRKRSIDDTSTMLNNYGSKSESKTDTTDIGSPPPYPGLGPIAEEPEPTDQKILEKMFDPSSAGTIPKEYLPGMFAPGAFGSVVDPSIFMAKKSAFLDTLFKTLATTTPTPAPVTDVPVPKSTIVPPSFWYPTFSIPSTGAYDAKVTEFLNKLFDSLKLNNTSMDTNSVYSKANFARSAAFEPEKDKSKVARSLDNLEAITLTKDSIVNSILSELGDLKANMVTTLDDLITYEKTATSPLSNGMKPFKSFPPGLFPKPLIDGTLPYKQRMTILSNVFDMLTELQRNITAAVQEAVNSSKDSAAVIAPPVYKIDTNSGFNVTLLDAIKSKLASLDTTGYPTIPKKTMRMLPKSPTSFWVAYPQSSSTIDKRDASEDDIDVPDVDEDDRRNRDQYARAVKMQMHQGYQSLPPGTVESVQAGGGSVPGHQGGGIKMLDTMDYGDFGKWINWQNFLRKESQGRRHHHDHH